MTKRVYRTAQGKIVDLGAIQLQNENVRAVGNMNVNARGDLVDHNNRSMSRRTQQVSKQYNRQVTNVSDEPVVSSRRHAQAQADAPVEEIVQEPMPVTEFAPVEESAPVTEFAPVEESAPVEAPASEGGLAAAIAKARQIKQEPLKSPRQQAQSTPGVRKI
jgi:hypothetical protein